MSLFQIGIGLLIIGSLAMGAGVVVIVIGIQMIMSA